MPHPVPIIIGTTIAVAATGYAFKKFVYDPHLAPIIDGFIEQQRLQRRRFRPIPVAVDGPSHRDDRGSDAAGGAGESGSGGRSTAIEPRAHGRVRQRRPAESYELDESRVLPVDAEMDKSKDTSMAEVSGRKAVTYQPRAHRRKPVPALLEPTSAPEVSVHPPLISMDKDDESRPPSQASPSIASDKNPLVMENPFADVVRDDVRPSPTASTPAAPASSTASSAAISLVASPAPSHTTLIEHPSPSITSASVDMDDLEIVSASGTMASYIDAESYTPRSLSPNPSTTNSRPISPPVSLHMLASDLTFPAPQPGPVPESMLGSDLTFPAPNIAPSPASASGRSSPFHEPPTRTTSRDMSSALSVSSWTEDDWRTGNGNSTDSEWDAVSDAPSR